MQLRGKTDETENKEIHGAKDMGEKYQLKT